VVVVYLKIVSRNYPQGTDFNQQSRVLSKTRIQQQIRGVTAEAAFAFPDYWRASTGINNCVV